MKIIPLNLNNIKSVSFQKKLIAKTSIVSDNKPQDAFVYQLEKDCDKDYFEKTLQNNSSWQDGFLIYSAKKDFQIKDYDFFVLEDCDENCLGYIVSDDYTDEFCDKSTTIKLLETIPMYSNRASDRKIKHVGKALIDFMKKFKWEKQGSELFVSSPTISALDFYEKQGFKGDLTGCVLKNIDF